MNGDESDFPPKKLRKLDENITNPDGTVPVFPEKQLECLLNVSIDLYERGADVQNEECQRFLCESLTLFSTKVLTDNVVTSWTSYAHDFINAHCEKLVKLCIHKLDDDSLPLLDLLAMVFDPSNKFHTFNAAKQSVSVPPGSDIPDEKLYARPPADPEHPRGWLVDLINKFGDLGGFSILLTRFQSHRRRLTISTICALLRPFGLCQELLTVSTIDKYLLPIFEKVREILDNLTDEELEKESLNQSISHDISGVMKIMTSLASRVPQHNDTIAKLESSRLKMILRLLEIVDNIPEFMDNIICNLTSVEDLDYFFQGFQRSWTTGNTEERGKLLDLIRQLLEDDQNDAMMERVLTAFWNIAHSDDVSTELMELALETHLQFLDYPGFQDRDALKNVWVDKCVEELKSNSNWTLQSLRQIRKICQLLYNSQANRQPRNLNYKTEVIKRLQNQHSILNLLVNNLRNYISKVRQFVENNPKMNETNFMPDGRYNHVMQLEERLDFYAFLLKDGECALTINGVKNFWHYLGAQPVFFSDRDACLNLFIKLLSTGRLNIKPADYKDILEYIIHQLDPTLLTQTGFTFFKKFFNAANIKEGKT